MGIHDWLAPLLGPIPDVDHIAESHAWSDDELREVLTANAERIDRITEGLFTGGGIGAYDPDVNLTAAQGGSLFFRRLTTSPRDLQPIIQERALQLAFWLQETNPLAKRVLELTRDFVLGEGVTATAQRDKDDDPDDESSQASQVQRVLDRFWKDPVNNLDLKLYSKVYELGLYGEQCYTVTTNPKDGRVRLGYIDPAMIGDVVRDPTNVEIQVAVILQRYDDKSSADARVRYKIIQVDDDPMSPTYGRMVGARTDPNGKVIETWQNVDKEGQPIGSPQLYAGSVMLFQVNKVSNAARGRTDLLSLIDWVDAYDQFLFNEVDRATLMKNFLWDVTLEGLDAKQIADYAKNNPAPRPGAVRYHNEKAKWEAVTPDLKTQDAQMGADLLASYVATGAGLPKTWINGTMDVNKATAQELGEPAFKRLTMRQRYVKYMVVQMLTYVLDQAELAGMLPARATEQGSTIPEPWRYTVNMPEIRQTDMSGAADTLQKAAAGLASARADGAIDVETEQEVLATILGQFGIEVDLVAMRERLVQEKADKAKEQQQTLGGATENPTLQKALAAAMGKGDNAQN